MKTWLRNIKGGKNVGVRKKLAVKHKEEKK